MDVGAEPYLLTGDLGHGDRMEYVQVRPNAAGYPCGPLLANRKARSIISTFFLWLLER